MDKIAQQVAANIYGNTSKIGQPGQSNQAGRAAEAGAVNFGDVLEKTARATIDTLRGGEKVSAEAVMGEADLNDVVQAVTAAELTLQTVVAVRDRLVTALQEVIRMPI